MPRKRSCSQKSKDLLGWPGEEDAGVFVSWSLAKHFFNSIPRSIDEAEGQKDKCLHSFIHPLYWVFLGRWVNQGHAALRSRNALTILLTLHSFPRALLLLKSSLIFLSSTFIHKWVLLYKHNTVFLMTKALKSLWAISEHRWSSRGRWM